MGPHSPATHSIKAFVLEKVKAPPTSPAAYENGHPILSAADCLARESESAPTSGDMVSQRERARARARERERERESARARASERESARARERGREKREKCGQTCTQQSCTEKKYEGEKVHSKSCTAKAARNLSTPASSRARKLQRNATQRNATQRNAKTEDERLQLIRSQKHRLRVESLGFSLAPSFNPLSRHQLTRIQKARVALSVGACEKAANCMVCGCNEVSDSEEGRVVVHLCLLFYTCVCTTHVCVCRSGFVEHTHTHGEKGYGGRGGKEKEGEGGRERERGRGREGEGEREKDLNRLPQTETGGQISLPQINALWFKENHPKKKSHAKVLTLCMHKDKKTQNPRTAVCFFLSIFV
jgi:hypothetical protein